MRTSAAHSRTLFVSRTQAQYALVSKSNTEKGVKRVRAYHEHVASVHRYDVDAALAGDLPGLGFYNKKWPGCIEVCGPTGDAKHPTIVFNCSVYRPSDVDQKTELTDMVTDKMLLFDALSVDLNDIRVGCHVINQAHGAGLHNFCSSLEKKISVISQDACVSPPPPCPTHILARDHVSSRITVPFFCAFCPRLSLACRLLGWSVSRVYQWLFRVCNHIHTHIHTASCAN
jgi:hypothetical protein